MSKLADLARALLAKCLMVLATLVTPWLAWAQRAELPEVKVGDEWRFAVYYTVPSSVANRVWVVTSITEQRIEGTDNGEPLRMTRELNVIESPQGRYSNHRLLSFPLEVGATWRYDTDWMFKARGTSGTMKTEVSVVAYEKIGTPAGTFDAYKLVAKGLLGGTSSIYNTQYNADYTATYWYAPAARAIVKAVHHNPYVGTSTTELVGLRLK